MDFVWGVLLGTFCLSVIILIAVGAMAYKWSSDWGK